MLNFSYTYTKKCLHVDLYTFIARRNMKRESTLLYSAISAMGRQPKEGQRVQLEIEDLTDHVTQLRLQQSRISADTMRRKRTLQQLLSDLMTVKNQSQVLGINTSLLEAVAKQIQATLGLAKLSLEESVEQEILLKSLEYATATQQQQQQRQQEQPEQPAHADSASPRTVRMSMASNAVASPPPAVVSKLDRLVAPLRPKLDLSDGKAEGQESLDELKVHYDGVELMTKTAEIQKLTLKHILVRTKERQMGMDVRYREMRRMLQGLQVQLDLTRGTADTMTTELGILQAKHDQLKSDCEAMREKRAELLEDLLGQENLESELLDYVRERDEIRARMVWDIRHAVEAPPLADPGIITHNALHGDTKDILHFLQPASSRRTFFPCIFISQDRSLNHTTSSFSL